MRETLSTGRTTDRHEGRSTKIELFLNVNPNGTSITAFYTLVTFNASVVEVRTSEVLRSLHIDGRGFVCRLPKTIGARKRCPVNILVVSPFSLYLVLFLCNFAITNFYTWIGIFFPLTRSTIYVNEGVALSCQSNRKP